MLHGDMGQSLVMERPVAPMLWDAFGRSAILAVASMAVVSIRGPGARRGRGGLARPLARSCRLGLRLSRHLAAGILLGSGPDPGVRQHLSSAALLRRRQPVRWARRLRCPSRAAGGDADADSSRPCRAADALQHGRGAGQHVCQGGARARPAGADGDPASRAAQRADADDHRAGAGLRLPDRRHRCGRNGLRLSRTWAECWSSRSSARTCR